MYCRRLIVGQLWSGSGAGTARGTRRWCAKKTRKAEQSEFRQSLAIARDWFRWRQSRGETTNGRSGEAGHAEAVGIVRHQRRSVAVIHAAVETASIGSVRHRQPLDANPNSSGTHWIPVGFCSKLASTGIQEIAAGFYPFFEVKSTGIRWFTVDSTVIHQYLPLDTQSFLLPFINFSRSAPAYLI
ncbi:hypothetical protein C8R47DRAFT_1075003 [Mycena vitilis]|nr:hypothetical protein C8R47DRAFT_1075003 [Mycena vitilis]